METQQHPRLEDWPIHQKIFSDLHPKCMFGVKQRCLLPVAFSGGQQAQPDQQACPLEASPPVLDTALLQMPPAFLAAQGKNTDKGEGEGREYTSPYHAFISKRTRELRAEGFKGNVSAKAVQEWKDLQAQQPQTKRPKVGSPPGAPSGLGAGQPEEAWPAAKMNPEVARSAIKPEKAHLGEPLPVIVPDSGSGVQNNTKQIFS